MGTVRPLAAIAVAALLVLSGCAAPASDTSTQAKEIREQSTASMQNVSTYSFTVDMTVNADAGGSIALTGNGVVDRDAERMRMDATLEGMEMTSYLVGDTQYTRAFGEWETQDVSGQSPWDTGNRLSTQREIMNEADIEIAGNDTVDGEPVYVLSLEPTEQQVLAAMEQQSTGGTVASQDVDIEDMTYRQYVSREDYRIRRVEMDMTMTINGEHAEADMTMTVDDYGEDVSITLPDSAPESDAAAALARP